MDLAIDVWTESFMSKPFDENRTDDLRNDDQYRGWIKCLKWCKKQAEELNHA